MNSSSLTQHQSQENDNNKSTSRFVKIIAGVATLGGLLFGYDTGVISGALLFMSKDLHLTPFTEGLVTSSLLFGAALGALISGGMANAVGRKKVILYLAIVFVIGTIGTSFAPNVEWMVAFRFILGIAVGGAATTVPIYIAEIAPSEQRGRMVTIQDLMVVSGQLLAYASNAAFHQIWGGDTTWRWMLFVATLPAIALWFGMLFMPDTPRWYAMKGKLAEARKVLQKTRLARNVDEELNEISSNLKEQANRGKASLAEVLKTPWLSKLLWIGIGIAVIQQASGVNAIMYYAPTMLTSIGMTSNAALIATVGNGIVSVIMTCFGIWLIGKISRRALIKLGQFGCTGSLVFIVLVCYFLPETVAGQPYAMRSYMVIAGMLMFLSFQQGALSPSTWLLLAEIFPSRYRSLFIGIAVFGMWIANFIISLLFPVLLTSLGLAGTLVIFVGIGVLSSIFIIKCVPETSNRTLEQIERDLHIRYSGKSADISLQTKVSPQVL